MFKKSIYSSICVALVFCPVVVLGATPYTVTPLPGPPGSSGDYPLHASSSSLVVGESLINNSVLPVTWQAGQPSLLPVPAGDIGVFLLGNNANGDAVGAVLATSQSDS